uniref:RRP7 domain-containing protein n=1 Tax=Steinernema glaseri TaxID=37863 RepID=A0A1I8A8M9_9BILA
MGSVSALTYAVSDEFGSSRQVFLKEDKSNETSIIVGNIPPFVSLEAVKAMLLLADPKADIFGASLKSTTSLDGDLSKGYRSASVDVGSPASVLKVLKNAGSLPVVNLHALGHPLPNVGMRKYIADYANKLRTVEELEKEVEVYMSDYDTKVAKQKQEAKEKASQPDEDGWVTVTRTKRKEASTQMVVKNTELIDRVKRRKIATNEDDAVAFYTFKTRESKAKHLNELRKRFEEDKKRVALAKAARKFNPL